MLVEITWIVSDSLWIIHAVHFIKEKKQWIKWNIYLEFISLGNINFISNILEQFVEHLLHLSLLL